MSFYWSASLCAAFLKLARTFIAPGLQSGNVEIVVCRDSSENIYIIKDLGGRLKYEESKYFRAHRQLYDSSG